MKAVFILNKIITNKISRNSVCLTTLQWFQFKKLILFAKVTGYNCEDWDIWPSRPSQKNWTYYPVSCTGQRCTVRHRSYRGVLWVVWQPTCDVSTHISWHIGWVGQLPVKYFNHVSNIPTSLIEIERRSDTCMKINSFFLFVEIVEI